MADREKSGGVATSLGDRVRSAVRSYVDNKLTTWFGAGEAPTVVAPAGTGVRAFDYPVGVNHDYTPRATESFAFWQLRALAENYDLMRLIIETRKDQVKRQAWQFRLKNSEGVSDTELAASEETDKRLVMLTEFFKSPDKEHTFSEWIGMILEDVLVIDAPVVYPRYAINGDFYGFDLVDGATVRRVISDEGKTPLYPDAAYQQIIKGVPIANATAPNPKDKVNPQFVYKPRNPRIHKIYGMSPVEQVAMTVNIALRRQISQLQAYTEGNMPEAMIGTPDSWTPEMIKIFEANWNNMFVNNTASRSRGKFVPGSAKDVVFTKTLEHLKDDYDEWLAKIIAFAFSISPQALIKQMNKASAQESVDASLSEGLSPILEYLTELINQLVSIYFGFDDIEFSFTDEVEQAPKDQAFVDDLNVRNGIVSVDEVRERMGLDPVGMTNAIYTMNGATMIDDVLNPPEPVDSAPVASSEANPQSSQQSQQGKTGKSAKKKVVIRTGEVTPLMRKSIAKLRGVLIKFFNSEKKRIANVIAEAYANETDKIAKGSSDADRIMEELDLDGWVNLRSQLISTLKKIFAAGGKKALVDLEVSDFAAVFDLVNQYAVDYSEQRSAELVGKRINTSGEIVDNPNAKWAITETTRNKIRALVTQAITDGLTPAELADAIQDSVAFDSARADMIARTEVAMANVQGSLESWKQSGLVVKKEWLLSDDHDSPDECDDNASEGQIDLADDFDSGDEAPPAHPNCQCDVAAEVQNTEEQESE